MFGTRRPACYVAAVVMLLAAADFVSAQGLGPESFSLPSTFGMSMPTTTRLLSMGTVLSAVPDLQFANPALAPLLQAPSAGARVTVTSMAEGPDLTSALGHYALPLRGGQTALGLSVVVLSSSNGDITVPDIGAATIGMSERAFVVDYGRRLAPRLTAGASILGYQETELTLAPPQGPLLLDVRGKADIGLRFGSAWEWSLGSFVTAIYSWTRMTVDSEGLMLPAAMRTKFTGDQLCLGASHRFGSEWLGAVEYQHGGLRATGYDSGSDTWHFGVEYAPRGQWSFRAGVADESPTFGFGYNRGAWRADYAFIKDWHDDDVGLLFGGSRTHSVQVIGTW